jgi:hypothetical protein
MSQSYFVSLAAARNLKSRAQRKLPHVKSAHLSEATAAALGFGTHAALLAALKDAPTVPAQLPQPAAFVQRLQQLGYAADPPAWKALPDLSTSWLMYRKAPVRRALGVRARAWRTLVVSAINAGLEQRLFGLSPGENGWPNPSRDNDAVHYAFEIEGAACLARARDVGNGEEMEFHVLYLPNPGVDDASRSFGRKDAEAFAHCWFEREYGAWIQDARQFECRRTALSRLAALSPMPRGYADLGRFTL